MFIKGRNSNLELVICNSFKSRLLGNMFKKTINNILCFPRCNSIHTFFMKNNLDIVMLNKNKKVIFIYNNLKPYKFILPKKDVYYVLEFPNNENIYIINDILKF